ncbi:MAG: zf-HC2 domain-containing protein [Acidobacteriota bacterium]|nr:zf-HC2 domain-containing protein [Acidobacteriota bacterium]
MNDETRHDETRHRIDCADCEALLCDYLDGALPRERRPGFEAHLAECAACAALARDAASALAFMDRAADVEPPPQLITKILYQIPRGRTSGVQGWLNRLFRPVLQPRYVMGAMLTILSLSVMTRCAGAPDHPLNASDLDPVKLWASLDDRIHRVWQRSLKTYESMRLVYDVQTRIHEWQEQQQEDDAAVTEISSPNRQLPMKSPPASAPTK